MKQLFLLLAFTFFLVPDFFSQTIEWSFKTGGSIHSSQIMEDGIIYIGSGDKKLYAINQTTGKKLWSYKSKGAIYSDVSIWEDLVIFGNDKGELSAVNKGSGNLEWEFKSEGEKKLDLWDYYLSSPVVSKGLVYWGSGDGHLYAIQASSGKEAWKFDTGSIVHATPVIAHEKILFGNYSGDFYALNPATGDEIWKFKAIGSRNFPNAEFQKAALVHEGVVYAGSRDLNLYALDIETGRGIWNMQEKGGSWIIATSLIVGNNLYFGTSDTYKFYSLNKNTGRENWSIPTNTRAYGSAVAYKNLILFPGFDGKIRGVNPETGRVEWVFQSHTSMKNYNKVYDRNNNFRKDVGIHNYTTESENLLLSVGAFINSPLLDENTLYIGSTDGRVYAVNID